MNFAICQNDQIISWSESDKIEWSDFNGDSDVQSFDNAVSALRINVSWLWKNGKYEFSVENHFFKQFSWAKDTSNADLLNHERVHFDISEVYARKLRKSLDSLSQIQGVETDIFEKTISSLLKERTIYDELYDSETKHSLDSLNQKVWNETIRNQLIKLSNYIN